MVPQLWTTPQFVNIRWALKHKNMQTISNVEPSLFPPKIHVKHFQHSLTRAPSPLECQPFQIFTQNVSTVLHCQKTSPLFTPLVTRRPGFCKLLLHYFFVSTAWVARFTAETPLGFWLHSHPQRSVRNTHKHSRGLKVAPTIGWHITIRSHFLWALTMSLCVTI